MFVDARFPHPPRDMDELAHLSTSLAGRGASDNVDIVVITNWWTEALAKLRSK